MIQLNKPRPRSKVKWIISSIHVTETRLSKLLKTGLLNLRGQRLAGRVAQAWRPYSLLLPASYLLVIVWSPAGLCSGRVMPFNKDTAALGDRR